MQGRFLSFINESVPFKKAITKICLNNFDPLKPHLYIVKLGFTGYTLFFLVLLKNILNINVKKYQNFFYFR